MKLTYQKYTLDFKFSAGTSRGVLKQKDTYILKLQDQANHPFGLGEAGPLKGLSIDDREDIVDELNRLADLLSSEEMPSNTNGVLELAERLVNQEFPSVRFGLETALLDLLNGGNRIIYNNDFVEGKLKIPINGLVWMGHMEDMLVQITEKVDQGFNCIKMKVGSLDFDKECDILQYIRRKYYTKELTLRVDANGAFKPEDAMSKLERLSAFDLHSIEQPIKPGQFDIMAELCSTSPIPIALDEELIGISKLNEKADLLDRIKPPYIILKPTLLGGLKATQQWIDLAEERKIGWWLTSALESNIGLNAITQYTAELGVKGHQGLGTGQLYHNNFNSPLEIKAGYIQFGSEPWDLTNLKI